MKDYRWAWMEEHATPQAKRATRFYLLRERLTWFRQFKVVRYVASLFADNQVIASGRDENDIYRTGK